MGFMTFVVASAAICFSVGDAQPYVQQELLFSLQAKHVHSSSFVECPDGSLLACWFYGSGERSSADVQIRGARLKKGDKEWSHDWLMADTPEFPDCNPVLYMDAQQQLWMFWIIVPAERWEDSLLQYRCSKDYLNDGPPVWHWQSVMMLKPGEEFSRTLEKGYEQLKTTLPGLQADFGAHTISPVEQLLAAIRDHSKMQRGWMTRCHALTLPSGRILLPLYSDGYYVGLMAISDDQGATWRPSAPIAGALLNQPSIARKQNGELVAYMREEGDQKKRVLTSTSKDDGETWSLAAYTDIPNPNSSLEVLTLQDGRWVMAYNDSEDNRASLCIALSDDEGGSWKWSRHLEKRPDSAFHYPFLQQGNDGRIHITYTYGVPEGKSIKHAAFNPAWIMQGD